MGDCFTPGDRSREQTARGSQKLSPADGGVLGLFLHARLLDERSTRASTSESDALYDDARSGQASKSFF